MPSNSKRPFQRATIEQPGPAPFWLARGEFVHDGAISSLLFSPDARILFAGDSSGDLRWWGTETGDLLLLESGAAGVTAFGVDMDGTRLAVAGLGTGNPIVSVYLIAKKKRAFVLRGYQAAIGAVAFSPDGSSLATVAEDLRLSVWNLTKKTCTFEVEVTRAIDPAAWGLALCPNLRRALCWASDGMAVFVIGTDGNVVRVPVDSDEIDRVTELGPLRVVGTSATGDHVVFCAADGRVGRLSNDGTITFLPVRGADGAVAANGNREMTVAAATRGDETLLVYDASPDATIVPGFPTPEPARYGAVAVEGPTVAWSSSAAIRLWSNERREDVGRVRGHRGAVRFVEWLGDGRLFTAGSDQRLLIWGTARSTVEADVRDEGRQIRACAVSPDRKRICIADTDGVLRLYEADRLTPVRSWKANLMSITGLSFSPDGCYLASAGGGGHARVWDVATATLVADLHEAVRTTSLVAWCPTGARVIFGVDRSYCGALNTHVVSFATAGWQMEWRRGLAWLHGVVFDRTGAVFAATTRGEVHVLDPANGQTLTTLGSPIKPKRRQHNLQGHCCVTASGDGPLAWADDEFQIHVSDSARSKARSNIVPPDMRCGALALDPNGQRLAIGGTRGQLGVWMLGSGELDGSA